MNRSDLSTAMANASGIPRLAAERALNAALSAVSTELSQGRRVTLAGFGTFRPLSRKARTGRDPRTGGRIHIAPCTSVLFVVSPELRGTLNHHLAASASGDA